MNVALVGGQIIDGKGNRPLKNGTIVIQDSKILKVSQQREFGSEVHVVDVGGKTIMPGLIDCHQHHGMWFHWLITEQAKPLMRLAAQTVNFLKGSLEAGCTAARDMGGLEIGFVQAIDQGLIPGPRIKTSLVIIQPTNGLLDRFPEFGGAISPQGVYLTPPGLPSPWCDGPDRCRAKVREVLRYGAHVIKIANSGVYLPNVRHDRALFTQEELDAIVDEAHRAGVPVGCHAYSRENILMAVRAGVDSIEEGWFIDEVCMEEMAKRETWYVPCLSNPHWWVARTEGEEQEYNLRGVEGTHNGVKLAMQAGVPIAMGTDSGYAVGETAQELKWLVEAGMTPLQAIETGTLRSAECMRMQDEIGTLEAGKEADLLVVDGDPLQDISIVSQIERLALVMKAGVPFSGPMRSEFPHQFPDLPRSWF